MDECIEIIKWRKTLFNFAKVSQMFKNVRYLYKMLGTTDISKIGNGTCTGAISSLNSGLKKYYTQTEVDNIIEKTR